MILKLFLVFGIISLSEVASANEIKGNELVSYNLGEIWQNFSKKIDYDCDDWREGVEQYYNESLKVAKKLPAPSFDLGATVMDAFQIYIGKLTELTSSNSTILASNATAILKAMSKLKKMGESPTKILRDLDKELPQLVEAYKSIVTSLSRILGELIIPVNEAITDLQYNLLRFTNQFLISIGIGKSDSIKEIDFTPVVKQAQMLINTIAFIAETTLHEHALDIPDVHEALTVLTFILIHFLVGVQGTNIGAQAILYAASIDIPPMIHASILAIEPFYKEINESVASITHPFGESVRALTRRLVTLTVSLNNTLDKIFGLFEGVKITDVQITRSILKVLNVEH